VTLANAALLGERLREVIASALFEYHGQRIPITVSIGVAAATDLPDTAVQLIANADAALYEAKRGGRNRVVSHAAAAGA
jgi:diguanylate cyclase (GGDEF)-like protein